MYKWKTYSFKADPEKVENEIQSMGDSVTAEMIVDFAKDKSTELHKCFEWNDKKAAYQYRLTQARVVMANLVYEIPQESKDPVYVRMHEHVSGTYKPIRLIFENKDEYQQLLDKAKSELHSFKERYHMIEELEPILALIE